MRFSVHTAVIEVSPCSCGSSFASVPPMCSVPHMNWRRNGAASHKGDIKSPSTTLDRCHEFEWRLPSLVSPNYEVHAARPAITAHAAALSKGVSTGPKLVSQ